MCVFFGMVRKLMNPKWQLAMRRNPGKIQEKLRNCP
jgi:hypothetical protein